MTHDSILLALTFLAPTAGIIAACVSLPLLALLYFLKLRRRPMRVSSTLLWHASASDLQVNVPLRWIRFSWILLLQAALLGLLALAIARPAIEGDQAPTGRIAIVIDRSASMSALDASLGGSGALMSRLDAAKAQARTLIDRLAPGAEAMIVAMAARPQALTSLTRDRGLLRRAVGSITPTDQPGDLPAAMQLVGAALRSSDEDEAPGRVILLSDGEDDTSHHVGPTGLGPARLDFVRVGPAESDDKDNLGIVAFAAKREYDDPAVVRLFVRIQGVAPRPIDTSLTILVDGQVELAERITIPGVTSGAEPAELARSFTLDRPAGGLVVARLGRSDALTADNTAALMLDPPAAPRILLVRPNVRSHLVDLLALDVLASIGPGVLDVMTQSEFDEAQSAGSLEARFDIVVLDRVPPSELPSLPTISLGGGIPIPGLVVRPYDEGDPRGAPTEFAFWKRTHPIMRAASLASVRIDRPMLLELPDPAQLAGGARAIELATGRTGPLIALIEHRGLRRLVIAFQLADSHWWRDASFPIFFKNAVDHLAGKGNDQAGRSWRTSENVSVHVDPGARELTVQGPLNFTRTVDPADLELEGGRQSLGALSLVGVYQIGGAVPADETIAVNLTDSGESSILTRDQIQIGASSARATTLGVMAPREIWQWLVLAALALLVVEWWVFALRMRL